MFTTVDPWWLLVLIVALLATVQSVFGVGLLVFGTPLLLLAGMPFPVILAYLLPCSLTISLLQVLTTGGSPKQIGVAVGAMLLVTAALRLVPPGNAAMSRLVARHRPGLLVGLGVVHGLSNLGGGILTAIVGSSVEDKFSIRRHIAFCYGLMASLQLVVVVIEGPPVSPVLLVTLPAVAAAVYVVAGQWLFSKAGTAIYQHALTLLLGAFGTLLVTR
jgi:uncharacterized protein